jgi:exodeoxyribonuclease V gamma subunit
VLVHSNGIAQWLRLALAEDVEDGGCGIAAGLDCRCLRASCGRPTGRCWGGRRCRTSPFDKPLLVWRLMRLLPDVMARRPTAPAALPGADADLRKRFQLAERLADLFDQYQVYRADWLAAWAAGRMC